MTLADRIAQARKVHSDNSYTLDEQLAYPSLLVSLNRNGELEALLRAVAEDDALFNVYQAVYEAGRAQEAT